MVAYLILASVIFISGASAGSLLVVIVGIRLGDHGKRLTGPAASNSEAFARWLLTGSRGYDLPDDVGASSASNVTSTATPQPGSLPKVPLRYTTTLKSAFPCTAITSS